MAKFSLSIIFDVVNKATGPLRRIGKSLKGLGDTANKVGKQMQNVGRTMSAALTLPIVAFGALSIRSASQFQAAMNMVGAVTNATAEELKEMTDLAREMGATTQFSATQAADGLKFLGMAGLDVKTSMAALPKTLQLAASAQLDMGTAADIVTNIMSGFRLEVDQLGRVNDTLVNAFTGSNTNLQELGDAMRKAGPVAAALKFDFEETAAVLGVLASNAFKGGEGGTALRRIMVKLAGANPKTTKALAKFGITTRDGTDKLRGLADVVSQFEDAIKRTGKETEINNLILNESLFGARGGPPFLAMIGAGSEQIRKFTGKLKKIGTAARVADAQMKGLPGGLKLVISAFEALQISVVNSIEEALLPLINALAKVLQWLSELNPTILAIISVIALLVAITGPLLIALGMITVAMTALSASMIPIAIVALKVLLIIGLLIIAAILVIKAWKPVQEFFDTLFESLARGEFLASWLKGIGMIAKGVVFEAKTMQRVGGGAAALNKTGVDVNSKNETDVNINVTGTGGAVATVEGVNNKQGNAKVNVSSSGFVGELDPVGL